MDIKTAKEMFGIKNENAKVFFAQIPRCIILDRSIPLAAKNLYYYLIARCDHDQGPYTWVSQKVIAEDMDMTRQWVNAQIKRLELLGLIKIEKTAEFRNVYMIVDVSKLYGDFATARWKKTEPRVSTNVDTPCQQNKTPPVNDPRQGGVNKTRHKEEEPHEKDSKDKKKEEGSPAPTEPRAALASVAPIGKKIKYDTADHELAKRWLEFAVKQKAGKPYPSWNAENFAAALAKVRSVTDLNHDGIEEIFQFIVGDDFWGPNAISPLNLLTTSKNGMKKIDNIILKWKGSAKFKTARDYAKSDEAINASTYKVPF